MAIKLFLRLDRGSLSSDDITLFASASTVTNVDMEEDCFQIGVDSATLDHASLLLGHNNSRFGFDLWHYLHSAKGFIDHISEGFLAMPDSTPDFKRRFSEDLGVAIGSLLLVEALGVKWQTIAHIPTNKSLEKHAKTPDFVGFDESGAKRVFECKGTTAPQDVDKHRQKAKEQLGAYEEAGVTKLATVLYIPASPKLIPPFMFVSDPVIELPLIREAIATGIHYLKAFQFSQLDELIQPLRQSLAQRYKIEESANTADGIRWADDRKLRDLNNRFVGLAQKLEEEQDRLHTFNGESYIGTWRNTEYKQRKIRIFTGLGLSQLNRFTKAIATTERQATFSLEPWRPTTLESNETVPLRHSVFSDGTLFLVEDISQLK